MKPLYSKLLLQGSNEIIGPGWLHYDCILNNLALDFWSLQGMDWVDSKQFGF